MPTSTSTSTPRLSPEGDEVLVVLDDPATLLPALISPRRNAGFVVPRMRRAALERLSQWHEDELDAAGGDLDVGIDTLFDSDGSFHARSYDLNVTIHPDSDGYYDLADLGQTWTLAEPQPAPLPVVRALIASAVDEWDAATGARPAARLYATTLVDHYCRPVDEPADVAAHAEQFSKPGPLAAIGIQHLSPEAYELAVGAINGLATTGEGWMTWEFDGAMLDAFSVDHADVAAALDGDIRGAAAAFLAADDYLSSARDETVAEALAIAIAPQIPSTPSRPEPRSTPRRGLLNAIEMAIGAPGTFVRKGTDDDIIWQARAVTHVLRYHRREIATTLLFERPLYEWAGENSMSTWTAREALGALSDKLLEDRIAHLVSRAEPGTRADGLDDAARLARLFAAQGPSAMSPTD